jgi:hypothetical protein
LNIASWDFEISGRLISARLSFGKKAKIQASQLPNPIFKIWACPPRQWRFGRVLLSNDGAKKRHDFRFAPSRKKSIHRILQAILIQELQGSLPSFQQSCKNKQSAEKSLIPVPKLNFNSTNLADCPNFAARFDPAWKPSFSLFSLFFTSLSAS